MKYALKKVKFFSFVLICTFISFNALAYSLIYPKLTIKRPLEKTDYIVIQQQVHDENVDAIYETALRHYSGYNRRLDMHFDVDYKKALKFFERAYKKDYAEAAYFIGIMNFKAQGVKKDYNKAIKYFKLASEEGISEANVMLSLLSYELYQKSGKLEFYKQDYLNDAKNLVAKEIKQKDPVASYNLAVIKLKTEKQSADLNSELSELLFEAVQGFSKLKDKNKAWQAMMIIRDKDLSSRRKARRIFNKEILGLNPVDVSPSVVY